MEFKTEIKRASSSKAKLVFVKVPDAIKDLTVDNTRNELSGNLSTKTGFVDWFSPKLPDQRLSFVGYSHRLTDEEIESIFSSRAEFYQMCNYHEILYNYSAYTGKWAVLAVA
jgi:hypothetical protein